MLDNRTQTTIRATLRSLTTTRVLIAHRLSTVVDVDRIYVMRDGRIVESGRYQELMERDGVLAEMAAGRSSEVPEGDHRRIVRSRCGR